ncbi:MAG TPA: hypothetical protein PKA80_06330 [Ignavibacteriaceae bacterium]|nr:hypothetical protein [Ignavibacteriaceae bacterium]
MELTEILTVILLISASVLCIALIYFLYQIVKSVHSISLNLERSLFKLNPLIESTIELSEKINYITSEVKSQLQMVRSMVSDVRKRVDKILITETKIRNGIENTVMPIVKNINAVGVGVGSFWKNFKRKSIKENIE